VSFRARLTIAAAGAVAIAIVLASAITYALVRNELYGRFDDELRTFAGSLHLQLSPALGGRCALDYARPAFGGPTGVFQLVTASGSTCLPRDQSVRLPVTAADRQIASGNGGESTMRDVEVSGEHVRVITEEVVDSSGHPFALQVARSLGDIDHTLSRVRLFLFLVALIGVGVAAGLGAVVTRAALAPVRRLTDTAEEVTETRDLSRRIDAHGHDELSRLASSFNTMLAALEDSARSQQRLVADASHELRTPLTSLRTNIEVLALDRELPSGEREKLLADVVEQLNEMTALVAELVELARGEYQAAEPEEVRLDLLVDEAVARARRNRPGVTFETDLHEATVHGVPNSIDRAVSNLLDNAAKWSPDGGTVEVAVDGAQVVVRDHGPGIADEDLPHVFDRFYRAANARGRPGSGLGLAIVRQVAVSHGGDVVAERPPDGGTRMRLRLEPNGRR
jgi:two-component system, OmpR family, sensor histidine kinase MprB